MTTRSTENFPVASLILPKHLRQPVILIYTILREMDDIADEGEHSAEARQKALEAYQRQFEAIQYGKKPTDYPFTQLADIVTDFDLPVILFQKMLIAFNQDTTKNRYANYAELLDYCAHSANPVGQMMLTLFQQNTPDNVKASDSICTALQLINCWQDIGIDYHQKNRCYIPQEIMGKFSVSLAQLSEKKQNEQWKKMCHQLVFLAQKTMLSGSHLGKALPGRFGLEIRLIIHGGLRITEKIAHAQYDTRWFRPTLTWLDWLIIVKRAVFYRQSIRRFSDRLSQDAFW